MKKIIALSLAMALVCPHALAETEANKTITGFGVEGGIDNGYFAVAEGLNFQCTYSVIFFTGKNFMNALLAAKLAGKKLALVNYNFDPATSKCTLVAFKIE